MSRTNINICEGKVQHLKTQCYHFRSLFLWVSMHLSNRTKLIVSNGR